MSLLGWLMLVLHAGLFLFLRWKYIGKKNKAEKKAAELMVENLLLKSKLESYTAIFKK